MVIRGVSCLLVVGLCTHSALWFPEFPAFLWWSHGPLLPSSGVLACCSGCDPDTLLLTLHITEVVHGKKFVIDVEVVNGYQCRWTILLLEWVARRHTVERVSIKDLKEVVRICQNWIELGCQRYKGCHRHQKEVVSVCQCIALKDQEVVIETYWNDVKGTRILSSYLACMTYDQLGFELPGLGWRRFAIAPSRESPI